MKKNPNPPGFFSGHYSVFDPKYLEVQFKYMKYNLNLLMYNTSGISDLRANYAYSDIWLEKFNYLVNPLGQGDEFLPLPALWLRFWSS